MNTIPVAIAFDANYLMPAIVMLTSLFENASKQTTYNIYVFITEKTKVAASRKLETLFTAYPRHTHSIINPGNAFSETAQNKGHLTTPNYYRFLMPDYITDSDKAFWIDVDMIVKQDLSQLYSTDLNDRYLAAVPIGDPDSKVKGVPYHEYYNAGFMLLNLDLWRKDELAVRINTMIEETEFNCPTQDPCNLATRGKTHFLPFTYNTMISAKIVKREHIFTAFHKIESLNHAVRDAAALHFVDKTKPWTFKNQPFFDEWIKYYNLTEYADTKLRLRWQHSDKIKRFFYQKKKTTSRRTIIKILKIPVYVKSEC